MKTKRTTLPVLAAAAVAMLLGGCSSSSKPAAGASGSATSSASQSQSTAAQGADSQSTDSSSAPATNVITGSAGTAGPGTIVTAVPGGSKPSAPPSSIPATKPTGGCLTTPLIVVYPPGDNPLKAACLPMGVEAHITLQPKGGFVWSAVAASGPAVVSLSQTVDADQTRHVTVKPLHPGVVTLSSGSSFAPDPHGPPSMQWTLTLTVVN